MPRSSQSSRSTSSSSGKTPLSCQSGSNGQSTYESARYNDRYNPGYTTTLSEPRSGYSSNSSSRSSKSDKIPLSISQGSSSSRDPGRSKTEDPRYYASSFLDSHKPPKKPLSCQKANDERYYDNSSYYR